jgi:class 3 adenylate cyclase/pimeloyl-ACP methyl ester carboxylesterase
MREDFETRAHGSARRMGRSMAGTYPWMSTNGSEGADVPAPSTHYAKTSDGVHIAYQVWGQCPDLLMVPGFVSHLDEAWESPGYRELNERLGRFARVITFDKRGTGMSDRPAELPDADRRMLDIEAVLDAAGAGQVTIFGISEGGAVSILFAATCPRRVRSLVLYGAWASPVRGPDHPVGADPEALQSMGQVLEDHWGTGVALGAWAPSLARNDAARQWWAHTQRVSASPGAVRALVASYNLIDVRPVLPLVQASTLILHRSGDRLIPIELGREIHEGIRGSRLEEFPGADHLLPTTNWSDIIDALEQFVTGQAPRLEPNRHLATVVFTDIVDSTPQLATLGDSRWQAVLDSHDHLVRREVERFGGRIVHGTGDGVLALFDGPTRAIRAASAITALAPALGVHVRAGLHTGEVMERPDGDVAGLSVHIAARVAGLADPDDVLVSRTTADLVVGSGLRFIDTGEHALKGIEGQHRLLRVLPATTTAFGHAHRPNWD